MKFVVTLVGSLGKYSLMMSVNECFVNVVFNNRRGSRDGDMFNVSFVVGRCVITLVQSLTGIVVVVVTLLSFNIIEVVSLTGIIVGVVTLLSLLSGIFGVNGTVVDGVVVAGREIVSH